MSNAKIYQGSKKNDRLQYLHGLLLWLLEASSSSAHFSLSIYHLTSIVIIVLFVYDGNASCT